MIHLGSSHSVSETVTGLETILKSDDHRNGDAAKGSPEMGATQLFIFWNVTPDHQFRIISAASTARRNIVEPATVNNNLSVVELSRFSE
jgi:hypothetical protein